MRTSAELSDTPKDVLIVPRVHTTVQGEIENAKHSSVLVARVQVCAQPLTDCRLYSLYSIYIPGIALSALTYIALAAFFCCTAPHARSLKKLSRLCLSGTTLDRLVGDPQFLVCVTSSTRVLW